MPEQEKFDFYNMLKKFGIIKLFDCREFYIAVILSLIFSYGLFFMELEDAIELIKSISSVLIGVDAAIFAIVLAGLAILLSFTDGDFLKFLKEINLFIPFFFPFYLASALWGMHIVYFLGLIFFVFTSLSNIIVIYYLLFFGILGFLYALLNSITLVGILIRLGYKKIQYDEVVQEPMSD